VAGSYDQPFGNSSVLPAYYCARLAREHGITRMLGGDGGDELFGGNTRYAKQLVFGVYSHIPALIRKPLLEPLAADGSAIARLPGVKKAASYVRQARVPMPDRMHTYNLLMRLGPAEVLTAAFLASIDPKVPERHQREIYAECTAPSLMNRMLAYDWRYTLAETDLPKVVGATKLAGVDTGFPMLDDRLVAFSSRLPPDYKVNRLKLRWFFKEALRGFLPDEIITKKKQGFGLPFGVWANQDSALLGLARDSMRNLAVRGIVRADFIEKVLNEHLPAYPGYYGEIVWILMMLEQWIRAHAPTLRFG
jgi:asparagine synthase (glutamine-hydrolysing)